MNLILWILQILLAIHTGIGAVWKFSHSAEQTMPSLKAIPNGMWLGMSAIELICVVCLIAPLMYKPSGALTPAAAIFIVVEMLVFCGVHIASGDRNLGPLAYWLIVAAISAFIAYGRFALRPL